MYLWATDHPVLSHFLSVLFCSMGSACNLQEAICLLLRHLSCDSSLVAEEIQPDLCHWCYLKKQAQMIWNHRVSEVEEGLTSSFITFPRQFETLETWHGWSDLVKITRLEVIDQEQGWTPSTGPLDQLFLHPDASLPWFSSQDPPKVCSLGWFRKTLYIWLPWAICVAVKCSQVPLPVQIAAQPCHGARAH